MDRGGFQPKPVQRPHPPLYQVCVSKDGIENTALRGWPMLNSVLFGPVGQLVANRDIYVDTLKKSGRSPAEIASLLSRWGVSRQIYVAETDAKALAEAKDAELWYQESFRRFVVPDRIEDAHPSLQPGFRAMAERLSKVTWEGLVAETLAFGSPETVARHIGEMRDLGVGQVMCWMNFGGLSQDRVRRSPFEGDDVSHFRYLAAGLQGSARLITRQPADSLKVFMWRPSCSIRGRGTRPKTGPEAGLRDH